MGSVRSVLRSVATVTSALTVLLAACDGGSNAPSAPTVSGIAVAGGNFQQARYGTALPIAPSVKLLNASGPVAGAAVVFAPAEGSGSVTGGSVTTDANGIATVGSWILGAAPGVNTLKVTSGTVTINLIATAVTGPASAITIKQGDNQSGVEQAHLADAIQVVVTDGQFPISAAQVDFAVTSGGGALDAPTATTNGEGIATLAGWRLGSVGANTMTAVLHGSAVAPVTVTANAVQLQVSAFTKVSGDNQAGFFGNLAAHQVGVEVRNQFNKPAEGVVVNFAVATGGGTVIKSVDTTGFNGRAVLGSWRLGNGASQSVTATVASAAPLTFSTAATPVPASAFNIDVRYPNGEPTNPAIKAAFTAAAARWQNIVVGDLEDIVLSPTDSMGPIDVNGENCIPLTLGQTIDDVVIFATVRHIDGPMGILGFATPIYTRDSDTTTVSGCMVFDEDDMDMLATQGLAEATITHEMGHVLGIGTLWNLKALTVGTCEDTEPTNKPYFTGGSARQAFRSVLGTGVAWTDSMVPLEGEGACFNGTRDGHPSEAIFKNELMTGYIDPVSNPLSSVTASMLRDLGLTVNDLATDAYTLPYGLPAAMRAGATGTKLNEMKVDAPIHTLDRRGRTTRIIAR